MTKKRIVKSAKAQPDQIPVKKLLLDERNPRLASGRSSATQPGLLKILWSEMAVNEIALSIAANGYLPEEPLLVYKHDKTKDEYTVVEGNRRLAAVLLLRSKSLREKVSATDLPKLSAKQVKKLDELPVSIYPDRESLWRYTGFRHINGPKPWDPFSKAQYVAQVRENYGVSLEQIARTIGDEHETVKRLYRGYKILEQAESKCGFDREDRIKTRFAFSHLYTAVADAGFQRFLGISTAGSLRKNPVPRGKLSRLTELMVWLYGKKSRGILPVIRKQQPDLWTLQAVISSPSSLAALRSGLSLETAHQISVGDERRFRDALTRAKEELLQARGSVIGYQGEDDLYETNNDIITLANAIRNDMDSKRRAKRRKS
jgi:hypothetical protein